MKERKKKEIVWLQIVSGNEIPGKNGSTTFMIKKKTFSTNFAKRMFKKLHTAVV